MVWRAFVALPVSPVYARVALLEAMRQTTPEIRPVADQNLHITLAFLGSIDDGAAPAVARAADRAAAETPPIAGDLDGVGAFPDATHPRVVWFGVRDEAPIAALADRVRAAIAGEGLETDTRPFRAHVTIGRVKTSSDPGPVSRFVKAHAARPLGAEVFDRICVYESVLGDGGPTYHVRHEAKLAGVA